MLECIGLVIGSLLALYAFSLGVGLVLKLGERLEAWWER